MQAWQPFDVGFAILTQWYGAHHGAGWDWGDVGIAWGDGHAFDESDFYVLNSTPKAVIVTNGGNALATRVILSITAGSAPITALAIASGLHSVTYTGTIAAGKTLVLDCGAWSILNDGVDAYALFARSSAHASPYWFALTPGANTVTVARVGGATDSTLTLDFSDAWE
jgi:hypothetical protein